jgi:hypothetical protein
MLQSLTYDVQQASTEAFDSGLLRSMCTIQIPDGGLTPSGAPDNGWMAVPGLTGIVCMDAVTGAAITATELKQLEEIEAKMLRHVFLDGCYPQLITLKMAGQVRALITDPLGNTVTYEVMGVEDDSQGTQTRFECQKVDL